MMQEPGSKHEVIIDGRAVPCRVLAPRYVEMIDEALAGLGDYGEVRKVLERGRLRYFVNQKSYDLLKFSGGDVVQAVDP